VAAPKGKPTMLFPDAHLATNRIRAMDADLQFSATSIEAGKVPFTHVALHAKLQDGVLALDPVQFEMPQGRLSGTINIDARENIPRFEWMYVLATSIWISSRAQAPPVRRHSPAYCRRGP